MEISPSGIRLIIQGGIDLTQEICGFLFLRVDLLFNRFNINPRIPFTLKGFYFIQHVLISLQAITFLGWSDWRFRRIIEWSAEDISNDDNKNDDNNN